MADETIEKIWARLEQTFNADRAKGVSTRVQLEVDNGESYYLEIKNQQLTAGKGRVANPRLTLSASMADLSAIFNGQLDPGTAFFQGRLHVKGDIRLATQLREYFN